jgi:hypothetical protein
MSTSRARCRDEIVKRLRALLQDRPDIAWARLKLQYPGDETSGDDDVALVRLVVMPSELEWSGLERQSLISEVNKTLGRSVVLEDERAIHPREFEKLQEKWEVLIDRLPLRRLAMQSGRTAAWSQIARLQQQADDLRSLGALAGHLQASAERLNIEGIVDFVVEENLFGPDNFGEEKWGEISRAAQETGRRILELCCDVFSLNGHIAPRSGTEALGFLVDDGVLESDCAVRLADWLSNALPSETVVETDLERVRRLLALRTDDLNAFCAAVGRAAAGRKMTKGHIPPAAFFTFDSEAALVGLERLKEQTSDEVERDLLAHIEMGVAIRHTQKRAIEKSQSEGGIVTPQPPIAGLLVLQDRALDQQFPSRVANALYGDPSLVYNVGDVLDAVAPSRQGDAVWGRSRMFQPIGIESLPEFVESHGRGVVYFEDATRADASHIRRLAGMAGDGRLVDPAGRPVFVGNMCLIVCVRFPIGTPREIAFHGGNGDEHVVEFRLRVEDFAGSRLPEHFNGWVTGRFDVCVEGLWGRYLQLVESGSLDEPLVPVTPVTPAALSTRNEEPAFQVDDLSRLIRVIPQPDKFDFFISYSWTRTAMQAKELVALLESRGHKVFYDKDEVRGLPPMEELVPGLVSGVRSSKAVVLFSIMLKEPVEYPIGVNQETELRHGRDTWVPTVDDAPLFAEWSWQTLELLAASHCLVVGQDRAYAVAHGIHDPDFISRSYRSVEQLADVCESYLELRHKQKLCGGY